MGRILLLLIQGESDLSSYTRCCFSKAALHEWWKGTNPFHVLIVQGVHSLTRSKQLVTALTPHGICVTYKVKRTDVDIAEKIIYIAGDNKNSSSSSPRIIKPTECSYG